jgi:hypothetical protein
MYLQQSDYILKNTMHKFYCIFKASHMLVIDRSLIADYTFIHTLHISGMFPSMSVRPLQVMIIQNRYLIN